jgi:hypothetical protein
MFAVDTKALIMMSSGGDDGIPSKRCTGLYLLQMHGGFLTFSCAFFCSHLKQQNIGLMKELLISLEGLVIFA